MSWLYSIVFAGLLFASNGEQVPSPAPKAETAAPAVEVLASDEIEKFEQSYPLSKNGNVSVSNVNGSITVEAWDRDEVRLEATKIADSKETLADVELEINATPDSFSVEAEYKAWKWKDKDQAGDRRRKLEVEFKLSVPRGAVLNEIETVNGNVLVSNFVNITKVSAVNGSVNATNLRGTADLSTVNGQVIADFDRIEGASRINLSTVNGKVTLTVPSDVNATLKADSLNGNIVNDFGLPVRKGQYVGRDLYGRIGSGEAQIKLNSVNGPLTISKKNDGRTVNPATNLLPNKKLEEDGDDNEGANMSMKSAAEIDREVERAMRESRRATADAMREAQKEIDAIGPHLERIKVDEQKNLEKMKINIDDKKLHSDIKKSVIDRQAARSARMTQAVWFQGAPYVERKSNMFRVSGTPKVTIEGKGCSVSVRGWDRSEVKYVITEMPSRRGPSPTVTEDHNSSFVTLKVLNNAGAFPTSGVQSNPERVRIEVYVPRKSNMKIVTDGEIRVDGISGEIDLKGENESINVRDVDGNLSLKANEAQVRVIGFKGGLDSTTECGDVFLEGDFKKLSARATDGTVTLTLPADANATLTSNTEVESDGVQVFKEDDNTWRLGKGGSRFDFDFAAGKLVVRSSSTVSSN